MDKNTILNYVTETPGNTNRAVLESMLDSIEGESSGSINTMSIAQVEFICTGEDNYSYQVFGIPLIDEGYLYNENIIPVYGESCVVDVVMAENGFILTGASFLDVDDSVLPVVTGDISFDSDSNVFLITGDGTITLGGTYGK